MKTLPLGPEHKLPADSNSYAHIARTFYTSAIQLRVLGLKPRSAHEFAMAEIFESRARDAMQAPAGSLLTIRFPSKPKDQGI